MDSIKSTRLSLRTWRDAGEVECRQRLLEMHSSAQTASLTASYYTILTSLFKSWSETNSMTVEEFVKFAKLIVDGLPSSSGSSRADSSVADVLVDIIWTLDGELEDFLFEAKSAGSGSEGKEVSGEWVSKKANAEQDKAALLELAKSLLKQGIISSRICAERLDVGFCLSMGIIPDKANFERKEVRNRTQLYYRQNKFNLLREQSEGYSKLTAELTASIGPPHSSTTGRPVEPYSETLQSARFVWQKLISIVGYFGLDPSRALDVILDVFLANIGTHYTFFLALLSLSPWAGSAKGMVLEDFPEGSDTPDVPDMSIDDDGTYAQQEQAESPSPFSGKTLDEILEMSEPAFLKFPPSSDSHNVLAQVLGFKFCYYTLPEVREQAPKQLFLTASLLIRYGFITLEDLLPYISPADADMDKAEKAFDDTIKKRISDAKSSLLAMAAPLESSTPSTSTSKPKADTKKTETPKLLVNQRSALLYTLISVGALRPAVAMMTRWPWLVNERPEIADLLIHVMKHSISPLYHKHCYKSEASTSLFTSKGKTPANGKKYMFTLWSPTPPSSMNTEWVYFYPSWNSGIPVCKTLEDLEHVIEPFLRFITVYVSRDVNFVSKLLRLGKTQLHQATQSIQKADDKSEAENPTRLFWLRMLRLYFLPALTLIRGNAVCTVEVWNILRFMQPAERWKLYGEWKATAYKSHPELRVRHVQVDREAKGLLRRLSHQTIDSLSGPVAKLVHSNPLVFFANAVNQVMAYDNMAGVVIQAIKFVTTMGFDTLVYTILEALSNPDKERVKDDGVNISDWLQSLASFIGMLFRRYHTDLTSILQYIVHQLHNGQTTEIVVLRELVWHMAGIEPLPSLSDAQVAAMAGGPSLRIEAVASETRGARQDPTEIKLNAPGRLGKFLLETKLALPLLIQVAQQRQSCVFKAPEAHLKSLASLYDTTHGVLNQYLELLTSPSCVPPSDYANKIIPSLGELAEIYGICPPICMQIIRPVLHQQLLTAASQASVAPPSTPTAPEDREKSLKALIHTRSRVATPTDAASDVKPEASGDGEAAAMDVDSGAPAPQNPGPWLPELAVLFDDVKKMVPTHILETLGAGFYVSFWQLSTYDLAPPTSRYNEETKNLANLSRQEDSKAYSAERSADRATRAKASLHRARREQCNAAQTTLNQEFKEQTEMRSFTLRRITREKMHWFAHVPKPGSLASAFVEYCIQPRCLLSPMDADFCAQMIKMLQTQGTPGFSTLLCYDKLLGARIGPIIFSCSEYEARNYGRFLHGVLSDLFKWFQDEQAWKQDTRNKNGTIYPGFSEPFKYGVPLKPEDILSHSQFRQVLQKWTKRMTKAFTGLIATGEYMHVYNAIIVLKEILPVFPNAKVAPFIGRILYDKLEEFLDKEERGDLKILGKAYLAGLKRREPQWTPPKVPPVKANGTTPVPPSSSSPAPQKASTPKPSTPKPPSTTPAIASTVPSAPRAQLAAAANANDSGTPVANRPAKEGVIPRPEVVKRVDRTGHSPAPAQVDKKPLSASRDQATPAPATDIKEPAFMEGVETQVVSPTPVSAAPIQSAEKLSQLADIGSPAMLPPTQPSQTQTAQELRETAKQSMSRTTADKPERSEDRPRSTPGSRSTSRAPSPSPRKRSRTPPSRPGTRSHSSDSRRSKDEDRRAERETRQESRDHGASLTRRDSLTHTRSRDRRDGDRNRDRHSDRDRDRGRDHDRDRERDKDRERERDRGGTDRHRKDDKEREHKKESRAPPTGPAASTGERSLPTRPEPSRHRTPHEENLGKRRRAFDDESDRSFKRGSRKESHRDERNKRGDRDDRRDSDRRKPKEREEGDEERQSTSETKPQNERKPPEGPATTPSKALPPNVPSGPRAMTSTEPRGNKADGGKDAPREPAREFVPSVPNLASNGEAPPRSPRSLLTRLDSREGSAGRQPPEGPAASYRPRDDREARKRLASEREKDVPESPSAEQLQTDPKRRRLLRNRYDSNNPQSTASNPSGALAKRLLPLNGGNNDRPRRG